MSIVLAVGQSSFIMISWSLLNISTEVGVLMKIRIRVNARTGRICVFLDCTRNKFRTPSVTSNYLHYHPIVIPLFHHHRLYFCPCRVISWKLPTLCGQSSSSRKVKKTTISRWHWQLKARSSQATDVTTSLWPLSSLRFYLKIITWCALTASAARLKNLPLARYFVNL